MEIISPFLRTQIDSLFVYVSIIRCTLTVNWWRTFQDFSWTLQIKRQSKEAQQLDESQTKAWILCMRAGHSGECSVAIKQPKVWCPLCRGTERGLMSDTSQSYKRIQSPGSAALVLLSAGSVLVTLWSKPLPPNSTQMTSFFFLLHEFCFFKETARIIL